ncbi:profilin, required for normal timing of actin polymerization in response to thermal stress [Arachnomyces sp. PD_36]|nr:profilin, required for normal timing of actin polymerization in response to thermal stress [Arachnomyces sp. PD_36]
MSWQAYVDTSLVGTGHIDKAAIFNSEGTSVWATTPGFTVSPSEISEVVGSFSDNSDVKKVQSEGFHIGGEKFVALKAEDRSLYGKKGKEGVVIVRTSQTLIVAHYPETVQPGNAANTVESLADYLTKAGY